jgi:hypothetical protein
VESEQGVGCSRKGDKSTGRDCPELSHQHGTMVTHHHRVGRPYRGRATVRLQSLHCVLHKWVLHIGQAKTEDDST